VMLVKGVRVESRLLFDEFVGRHLPDLGFLVF
jgi:hypothetical protein